ncbi:unnamed protein product [Closterium sp. NIES-65]|nr:unnamed protein product [Closterium sp. NIES-65]
MSTALSPLQTFLAYVQEATGLAPSTTVSLLVLIASIIYVIFSYVQQRAAPVPPPVPGPPEPIKIGEITLEELSQYSGSDPEKPILLLLPHSPFPSSCNHSPSPSPSLPLPFSVPFFLRSHLPFSLLSAIPEALTLELFAGTEASRAFAKMHFYGPGGPYEVFAGKEASRAFAKMSTDPKDAVGDLTGLTYSEMETLRDWESSLQFKYDVVGSVKGSGGGVGGGDAAGGAGGAGETQGEGGGAEADAGTVAAEGEGGEGEEGGEKGAGGD